ncbi:hypothetical protein [Bacillus sp. USDA818B3_A]|uniref:hypothetical protein n=1 Tax=Bacillus sp. USDA818B3_A TaxID=2698834 RepID=UPI00136D54AF|nr:hypothetical protein [Bacillus sp. USDA818B3_A]
MKKLLTVIGGLVIAGTLFITSGNTVKASENEEPCTCHDLKPLQGPERNKLVADLLSSKEFKAKKHELLSLGYKWNGAHSIEVMVPMEGVTMIGVPFVSEDGNSYMYVFINGVFTEPVVPL